MNGVDTHFSGLLFDDSESLAAKAAAAMIGSDVQFVDEGIVAMKFEAEADGQDDIANERRAGVEEPGTAKSRKRQKLAERRTSGRLVKYDGAGLVFGKAAHHGHKSRFVLQRRFTKLQWEHVIHRSARGVSRRDRSSRSDGWRRYRRHCRRENIRRKEASRASGDRSGKSLPRQRQGAGRFYRAKRYARDGVKFPQPLARDRPRNRSEWETRL